MVGFQKYDLPNLGWTRLPLPPINEQDKVSVGLNKDTSSAELLRSLCYIGFEQKIKSGLIPSNNYQSYIDKCKEEIETFEKLSFVDYVLLVWKTIVKVRQIGVFIDYGRGCLNGDAFVITSYGPKKLRDVSVGDKVLTADKMFHFVKKILRYECDEKLIKINTWGKTHDSPLMTADHKVLCISNPFKHFKSQKWERPSVVGVSDSQFENIFNLKNAKWIRADQICRGDYLLRIIKPDCKLQQNLPVIDLKDFAEDWDDSFVKEHKRANSHALKRTLLYNRFLDQTQDFLYVLGYFIGDGWVKTKGSEIGFAFHSENNIKQLKKIKNFWEHIGVEIYENSSKKKKLIQLIVRSKIFKKLFKYLVPDAYNFKKIPNEYLFLNNEKSFHLLEGLIDADGHIENRRFSFDSTSETLIHQIKIIIERCGLRCATCKRIQQNNCALSYKLRSSNLNGQKITFNCVINDGVLYKKVRDIEEALNPDGEVFDLEIEHSHSYQTSDFMVHNSCVSSLVFWLLNITGCDPIKHKLFFSRFVSKSRAKSKTVDGEIWLQNDLIPDADLNLGEGRGEIVKWLKTIYPNRISRIANLSTLTGKALIKDVYKVMEDASEEQSKEVSDWIERRFGVVQDLEEAYKEIPEFKKWADNHKQTYEISLQLRDLNRQFSSHASGYLISFDELINHTPLMLDSEKETTSVYTMNDVQCVKLDLLGLNTNRIIKTVLRLTGENVDKINLENDPIIYDQFQKNEFQPYGLYQISAPCAYRVTNDVKPKDIMELSDVNALARPGALAWVGDYVKNNKSLPHPLFEKALKPTRNLPLYQETLMQLLMIVGFSADESETCRKIVGKKLLDKVREWQQKILDKTKESGFEKEIGELIWKILNDSSSYSFNKCLSPDTIVETKNGEKMMFEIQNGERIRSFDVKKQTDIFVGVKEIIKSIVELYEVELDDGRKIKASLDHKFLCEDMKMRKLSEILVNKYKVVTD